ncbi:UbiA family prenyltransferase [Seonamhaeicola aphaedonensis]|nr:UbiA family prenyltransferase [Seonamhaeicola aphaedonensis]
MNRKNSKMKNTYPIFNFKFFKAYLIQCRPYLLFLSGIVGLSGIAIAVTENISTNLWSIYLAFVPLFLGYGFGQALTDTWQIDTDSISAPYRPLSKGVISIKSVRIVSILGLVLSVIILVYLNFWNIILGALSVFGLITYSYFKKNFWFVGPFYNAWIVALLPLMGYISIVDSKSFSSKLLMLVLLSFMSYTNFVLMGYLKDISADRETGYKTFPVVFGWNRTVWIGDIIVLLSTVLVLLTVETGIGIGIASIATILTIYGQIYAHLAKVKEESYASIPVEMTVRSFILWQIAVILDIHPNWLVVIIIFYLFFEVFLFFRPEKSQI